MNKIIYTFVLLVITLTNTSFISISNSDDVVGEVIWEKKGCDYYIIETNRYYALVEWYRGKLYEGDKVVGPLHTYGFKYLINKSRSDVEVKVYIENYWPNKNTCFEWLKENEKCDIGDN